MPKSKEEPTHLKGDETSVNNLMWDYRRGRLTKEQREAFEKALKENSELRDELEEINKLFSAYQPPKDLSTEEKEEMLRGIFQTMKGKK